MRRPSVLVVDDDAFSRAVVARKIARLADVVEAADGLDALSYLQTADFDLAIVDLEMPNFDGLDLIRSVRGHPTLKHIPLIVLTGNETRAAIDTALAAGATSFLLKPLDWSAFGEHIRHVLHLAHRAGHMAVHDNLTGLPNRALLNERLNEALARVSADELVAIHILDLDHLKSVNDALGHPVGDKLLQTVSRRLRALMRDTDTIARMGGDEFAIVQAPLRHAGEAEALAQSAIDAVHEPYEIDGHSIAIGVSIGIAAGGHDTAGPEHLMRSADLALYRAKDAGRNVFRMFEPEMDAQMRARRCLENDLRRALVAEELELYYQPVVNLERNEISGFEALVRWHHPDRGLVAPDAFIPLAEEIGLIVPIGEWTIRRACETAAQWPGDLAIAVNVSSAQVRQPGLVQVVAAALAASGLPPSRLELEITETARLVDDDATLTVLRQLRALGVCIAADDFGTGYSSLSYLRNFPIDRIKIDCSFVRDINDSPASLNIVRALAALANGLGIATTAEGVENEAQLESIRLQGCTEMQGFLMSEPLPAREVERLLTAKAGPPKIGNASAA